MGWGEKVRLGKGLLIKLNVRLERVSLSVKSEVINLKLSVIQIFNDRRFDTNGRRRSFLAPRDPKDNLLRKVFDAHFSFFAGIESQDDRN